MTLSENNGITEFTREEFERGEFEREEFARKEFEREDYLLLIKLIYLLTRF